MLEYGNICSLFYYISQLLSTYVSSAYWVCLGGSYVWDIFLLTKLDQCVSVWCHDFEQNFNRGTSDRVVINATHSTILAWKSPWTEEPGRLQLWGRSELDTISEWLHFTVRFFQLLMLNQKLPTQIK